MKKTTLIFLCIAMALSGRAQEKSEPFKLLSIGNSFSGNAHHFLRQITDSMGDKLILGHASIGGCSLERHWSNASTNGLSYKYKNKKVTLAEYLQAEKWDVVTIQQVSNMSRTPSSFEPYGSNLVAFIRQHAPQAEIVVHQIWSYRRPTLDEMRVSHEKTRKTYHDFAKRYGLRIIPAGDAIQLAREEDGWDAGYVPPNQKTGASGKGKALCEDGFHTGPYGSYLIGCLWYEYFFKKNVQALQYCPKNLSEEEAIKLRTFAHRTLTETKPVDEP
jgi:hypothetical protein